MVSKLLMFVSVGGV